MKFVQIGGFAEEGGSEFLRQFKFAAAFRRTHDDDGNLFAVGVRPDDFHDLFAGDTGRFWFSSAISGQSELSKASTCRMASSPSRAEVKVKRNPCS